MKNLSIYLLVALEFPHLWSSGAAGPEPGCLRSSSGQSCCRHWLYRTPGSSVLRRHCGVRRSSGGPTGPPEAGCLPVAESEGRGWREELGGH